MQDTYFFDDSILTSGDLRVEVDHFLREDLVMISAHSDLFNSSKRTPPKKFRDIHTFVRSLFFGIIDVAFVRNGSCKIPFLEF